ncbi:MAG: hypothetical protein IIW68_03215, partial [Lachnospiraceae bacterium]|nr:hypothetical protein [Lachnospiraceae bacterium]
IQDAKGWWFKKTDGTWASDGWAYLTWNGQDSWYYFDAEGYLVTGWVLYNGNWYYMHPIADGTQGHLYTGWNLIDGQWFYMNPEKGATQGAVLTGWNLINNIWYYFSEVKDSTEGMMLSNTTTPDGYKVGADGAWIQ